jgi:hypothetical protein
MDPTPTFKMPVAGALTLRVEDLLIMRPAAKTAADVSVVTVASDGTEYRYVIGYILPDGDFRSCGERTFEWLNLEVTTKTRTLWGSSERLDVLTKVMRLIGELDA